MNLQSEIEPHIAHQQPPVVERPLRVGLVGAGNITNMHLKGYAWAGIPVSVITDLNENRAQERALQHNIPEVAASLEDLLTNDAVDIVDLNFPGNGRLEAVRKIAEAGKPVLVQKPMADDYSVAREMVEICEAAGVPLAVNMNARFCPQYRTARQIVEAGILGDVYHILHHLSSNHDGMPHHAPWLFTPERYQILQFGVHHLDAVATWFGSQPRAVTATSTRKPDQQFRGEMLATLALDYGETKGATLLEFNALHAQRPYEAKFELNGTRGALIGSFAGALTLYHADLPSNEPITFTPEGKWFPNAFGEVMANLINSVAKKQEPEVSGRAHLDLLATIEGCYRSMAQRRTVDAAEFLK